MTLAPRLQYQLAKFINLRDGEAGRPPAPVGWPYENSQLMPRWPRTDTAHYWKFNYNALYGATFASYYGYGKTLCQLVNEGIIHEVDFNAHTRTQAHAQARSLTSCTCTLTRTHACACPCTLTRTVHVGFNRSNVMLHINTGVGCCFR